MSAPKLPPAIKRTVAWGLYEAFLNGSSMSSLARAFGYSEADIEAAIRWHTWKSSAEKKDATK